MSEEVREVEQSRGDGRRGRGAESPFQIPLSGWKDIALRIKDQFSEDHVTLTAAGVAFFAFSALAPTLAAAVSIYGLGADPSDIGSVVDRVRAAAPAEVADLVEQQLRNVTDAQSSALGFATVVGILLAIWSASSGMAHLMEAINIAYDEDTDDRPFWKRRLLAIGLTLGFVGFVFVAVALFSSLTGVAAIFGWVAVAVGGLLGLAVLYRYAPDRDDPEWEWITPGAVVAMLGWLVVSFGFRFYVSRFGSYNETYGALGSVVVMLTWLYLSAVVVVLGAEINTEIERQTLKDTTIGPDEPLGRRGADAADTVADVS